MERCPQRSCDRHTQPHPVQHTTAHDNHKKALHTDGVPAFRHAAPIQRAGTSDGAIALQSDLLYCSRTLPASLRTDRNMLNLNASVAVRNGLRCPSTEGCLCRPAFHALNVRTALEHDLPSIGDNEHNLVRVAARFFAFSRMFCRERPSWAPVQDR